MGKKRTPPDSPENQEATKRLANDLSVFSAQALPTSTADDEMLSLMVSEAIKGVDIPKRYPTFYQRLLSDPNLRQAFVDLLGLTEDENKPLPFPKATSTDLDFLSPHLLEPRLEKLSKNKWLVSWKQTVEQLQTIFSPSAFASRKELSLLEDRWFILLRDEIDIEGSIYTLDLEGASSEEESDAISAFLNLAVTLEAGSNQLKFPIQASLKWGSYQASILITEEGRAKFPNIPFIFIFDNDLKTVKSDLDFSLEIIQ